MSGIDPVIAAKRYAHPEALVSTDWLAEHLDDDSVRIVECDEDVLLYEVAHIPGAQKLDWHVDLNDPVIRDYVGREQFQELLRSLGIDESKKVVFYGDRNNWWAAYAFWVFKLFGFANASLLDGGRAKWEAEGRKMNTTRPNFARTSYDAPVRSDSDIRAFSSDALNQSTARLPLVDVRSPEEFTGERTHMVDYPQEGTLRGGHIPGARSVPWTRAANTDSTFRSALELRAIYEREQGLSAGDDIITYCRIGERSAHTWFVLQYLLGYPNVRNYDGSWTEWGNTVRAPIEVGS
ncbi:MAG: sulfurtransferase [Gemmatimonadaceae bacterium]